jgi:PilZ domain
MSDDHDAARMIEGLESRVALPADFFEKKNGAIPVRWVDLRQFPRFYFRSAAALEVQSTLPALPRSPEVVRGYVKDISRAAVAVLHSEQLFPGERLWVTVLDGVRRGTTVTRCRRIQDNCYEVAARFDAAQTADE